MIETRMMYLWMNGWMEACKLFLVSKGFSPEKISAAERRQERVMFCSVRLFDVPAYTVGCDVGRYRIVWFVAECVG